MSVMILVYFGSNCFPGNPIKRGNRVGKHKNHEMPSTSTISSKSKAESDDSNAIEDNDFAKG